MMPHTRARINPDSLGVLVVALVITSLLAVSSFLLSYAGLVAVSAWAAVPPWLSWAVPVTVDGAILVYTLATLVFRARGETARTAWLALSLFTGLSVVSNAAHAWVDGPGDARGVLGATIAGLAPVAVLLTTHTLARLVVARPDELAEAVPSWDTAALAPHLEAHRTVVAELADVTATPAHLLEPSRPLVASSRAAVSPMRADARNTRIRELDGEGKSLRAIAAEVRCSKSTVARVLGRTVEEAAEPATLREVPSPAVLA